MTKSESLVQVDILPNRVAKLTLSNPPVNAVTLALRSQLEAALERLEADRAVGCIVLTGAGKAFCAGSDIKEFPLVKQAYVELKTRPENLTYGRLESLSKPVIAAIEGFALGGGCEITLACDFRVIAEDAKIGLPEVLLGIFPSSGGLYRLPRLIGLARARELMFFGQPLTAQEAERIGLVTRVAPVGRAVEVAVAMAGQLAAMSAESLRVMKQGLRETGVMSEAEAMEWVIREVGPVARSADFQEGFRAFMEKRTPKFNAAATV